MKIITVPHSTLRTTAQAVPKVDKKLRSFVAELEETLKKKDNPKGVGLAAPQVDVKWRIFTTQLSPSANDSEDRASEKEQEESAVLRSFINPEIIDFSEKMTFGPNKKEPILEGCLSIPGIYGPIPRAQKLVLQYQVIEGDELVTKKEEFKHFAARVVQHELDHLNGVLFIDYTAEYQLPLYKEDQRTGKLHEIDSSLIPALVERTR